MRKVLGKGSQGLGQEYENDLRHCDEPKLPPASTVSAAAENLGERALGGKGALLPLLQSERATS